MMKTATVVKINLCDSYLRFYFRFIAPNQDELAYRPAQVLSRIRGELRAFVGLTAFEELARQWVAERGRAGQLPYRVYRGRRCTGRAA
jgi:hypothetical protein